MQKQDLIAHLKELQIRLAETKDVDPETLDQLEQLTGQVEDLLDREEGLAEEEKEPVAQGLKGLLLQFETEHPQMTDTLGRIADGLARMGI